MPGNKGWSHLFSTKHFSVNEIIFVMTLFVECWSFMMIGNQEKFFPAPAAVVIFIPRSAGAALCSTRFMKTRKCKRLAIKRGWLQDGSLQEPRSSSQSMSERQSSRLKRSRSVSLSPSVSAKPNETWQNNRPEQPPPCTKSQQPVRSFF